MKNNENGKPEWGKVPGMLLQAIRDLAGALAAADRSIRNAVAALLVTASFCLMRFAYTEGLQGHLTSLAFFLLDVGIFFHLHVTAKDYRVHYEAWQQRVEGRAQKVRLLEAVERDLQITRRAIAQLADEMETIHAEIALRERLNFDIAQVASAAAAAAREGFLAGLDANRDRYAA